MGTVNTKAKSADRKHAEMQDELGHRNWMGGMSYDINNPFMKLRMAAASCFFGEPQYYHTDKADKRPSRSCYRGDSLTPALRKHLRDTLNAIDPQEWRSFTPTQMMEKAIDEALDADVEKTLQIAVALRNSDFIRTTPQIILVRAANHANARGTGIVNRLSKQVIARPDELAVQLAYQLATYGEKAPIPNSLKKAWKAAFERFNEYQLAKYRMESREVKLVDVMNICHPKSEAVAKLAKGEAKVTGETWEAILSEAGEEGSGKSDSEKVALKRDGWLKSIEKMGHMALLRNLRNMLGAGVKPEEFCGRLVETAAKGKQLPFRYYAAFKAVENAPARVKDAIEECMEVSLGEMPHFAGKTMSLCDYSGSAQGATTSSMGTMRVCDIGGLTGAITARCSDEGHIGIFGDRLETFDVRKRESVFDVVDKCAKVGRKIGEGTENGIWLFFDKAIKQREHWDNVFVYSDMQAGHGGLYGTNPGAYSEYLWGGAGHGHQMIDVAKLIKDYRNKVNPRVNVFLVQIAGQQDSLVPEFYERTYILGGWGTGLLHFADAMGKMQQ
jgi:hypothetical protein